MARLRSLGIPAALSLAAAVVAGCVAPGPGAAGGPVPLYVANARDGTITMLDSESGRPLGPPVRAGRAPAQLVAAPAGNLLHLTTAPGSGGAIKWLRRTGGPAATAGWDAQPLALPLREPVQQLIMASDGSGGAAVAYRALDPAFGAPRCRLALVDMATGTVTRHPHAHALRRRRMAQRPRPFRRSRRGHRLRRAAARERCMRR
jgi:hypothetical protein